MPGRWMEAWMGIGSKCRGPSPCISEPMLSRSAPKAGNLVVLDENENLVLVGWKGFGVTNNVKNK